MKNALEGRTKGFAIAVIQAVGRLPRSEAARILGGQLIKSGTSIGANYREANRAQSHDDFIHKIALCEKEAAETGYWIELLIDSGLRASGDEASFRFLLQEAGELLAIFVASGRTAKRRKKGAG